jgi:K+/H+ antiporter YhaU regulatory subunit KhtT
LKDTLTIAPPATEILGKNDILIVIGEEKNIDNFKNP